MQKVLISMPDQLAARMRSILPARQRSKTIVHLLEEEIQRRENLLYECALSIEKDEILNDEMDEWDVTIRDGLNDESW
jgi:hypothetical protein